MKRVLPLILTAIACVYLPGSHANDIEPGKEYYSAIHTPRPVVVDGDLSEWSGVPVLADPKFSVPKGSGPAGTGTLVLFEEYAGGTWTGPDDQTSAVQIAYDADNVYFGFVVTDDYHENAARSAWNGDSIQLMIANADRNQQVALYNYALGGVEEDVGLNDPSNLVEANRHEAGPACIGAGTCLTEVAIKRNTTTHKTTYEIRLPKASLGLATLTGGVKFGLGMAINDGDKDTPGQKGWGGLGAHAIVFGKSPGETALVTLARRNDIEPGKEVYTANPAPKPIVLDGNLSEWSGVPVLADPKFYVPKGSGPAGTGTLVLFEEYAGGTWTGPDDQTSAVQIVYDAENVYFGFVVTDDYHENAARSAWNGDSIQLMIANGAQTQQVALYNYALGGVEEDVGLNDPANLVEANRHEAGPACIGAGTCLTDVAIFRNTTTHKTTYEIKLPKAALGLNQLVYGTQFGLGMAINDGDKDTPGQKGWGGLGAHAIVFGKSPGETALVTLGVGGTAADLIYFSAVNPTTEGFSFRVNNLGSSVCDPSTARLYIDGAAVTLTITPKGDATDFAYVRPTPFPPGSEHTYILEVKDTAGRTVSDASSFVTVQYALLTAEMKVTPNNSRRGFLWNVHQNSAFQANNSTRPVAQLRGELGVNYADRLAKGVAVGPGTAGANNRLPVSFEIATVINLSQEGLDNAGDFVPDDVMPGIPGTMLGDTGPTDGIAGEIVTYIELPAGKHTLAVRSDDGFFTTAGNVADLFTAMKAADSAGAVANLTYPVYVQEAGVYPFRTVWEEGGGGANIEWSQVLAGGTRVLLNDDANGAFKTYRALSNDGLTAITGVTPAIGSGNVLATTPIQVVIQEGVTAVDTGSVKLYLNGTALTPTTVNKVGKTITATHQPASPLGKPAAYTAKVTFTHGGQARMAEWSFTVPATTLDKLHSYPGLILGTAAQTPDKGGRTGQTGDRAMDFGTGGTAPGVLVPDATWVNATAAGDVMTVSVWVKRNDLNDSSAFWFDSPSSPSNMRAFQAHLPWSDNSIYFDTAGCCIVDETRISLGLVGFPSYDAVGNTTWWTARWHHFAFVKDTIIKTIYIDGEFFHNGYGITPLPTDIARLWIGAQGGGANVNPTSSMHGLVDDFAVFGTALTEAQVKQLAAGTLPSALPASAKALAHWDFNEVPVTTPPKLTITLAGSAITIAWDQPGFRLQSSGQVNTGYADVPGVSGMSYATQATQAARYYRMVK